MKEICLEDEHVLKKEEHIPLKWFQIKFGIKNYFLKQQHVQNLTAQNKFKKEGKLK